MACESKAPKTTLGSRDVNLDLFFGTSAQALLHGGDDA
jgi:hypothetical protein